jgi:NAD(P)-dependent dehydrogenase (short-subunit alcohol dehydrogenase family)
MAVEGPVIVTGASTGIGAATTKRLLGAGREVISIDVKAAPEGVAVHHHCDLTDPAAIDAAVGKLDGRYASLLNIAGVPGTVPADVVVKVNTLGLRYLTEALWDRLVDGGTVVNVSSIAGNQWKKRFELITQLFDCPDFQSGADWWEANGETVGTDPYTFSKEAVVVYTMQLAGRGLARGIRVNDVGPGPVDTPIFPDFARQVGEEQMEWLCNQVGRPAKPDDIAQVLTWLAIGDHDWLNGQHIIVDGGLTAGLQARWVDRASSPRARPATP